MMNSARFQSVYNGLSSVAQKVFAAVPMSEPWSASQVHAELVRTGKAHDLRNTEGCLNNLVQSGLVYENKRNQFIRAPIRGKKMEDTTVKEKDPVAQPQTQAPAAPVAQAATPAALSPIDKLTSLSARLRSFAEEIDNIALDFTEQLAASESQSAKLRQLQLLLKELA